MSFLSHFYEAFAFSDKLEICVTHMGIPLQLCRNVPSVLRKAYLFLSAYSLLGIILSLQEIAVIKINCPTQFMF